MNAYDEIEKLQKRVQELEDAVKRLQGYTKCKCGEWNDRMTIRCSCGEYR